VQAAAESVPPWLSPADQDAAPGTSLGGDEARG
jgi:hypothetical protein